MRTSLSGRRPLLGAGLLAVVITAGCSGPATPAPTPVPAPVPSPAPVATPAPAAPLPAPPPPPLAGFAGRKLAVFPLQRLAGGDSTTQPMTATGMRARGAAFDSAFARVLEARGLGAQWVLAPAMARIAQREVINRTDVRALAVQGLGPQRRPNDLELREPLASQLRPLVAMADVRFAVVPVDVRVTTGADGRRTARLRVAVLDVRAGQVLTIPEVTGAPAADEAAALEGAAVAFADLVLAP
jgi:hypothetical protein